MLVGVAAAVAACANPVAGNGTATVGTTSTSPCTFTPAPPSQAGAEAPVIGGELQAVTAVSAADAWAVGDTPAAASLIIRTSPALRAVPTLGGVGTFEGVAATSPTDAWAVGLGGPNGFGLIEHWNGRRWSPAPVPGAAAGMELHAVAALTATSAWAVGEANYGRTEMIFHWNGAKWLRQAGPATGSHNNQLLGVAATSDTNAWAVGGTYIGSRNATLIEHWDGTRWSVVPSPVIPGGAGLAAVATAGPADAWAVGALESGGGLIEHWDGRSWTLIPSPSLGLAGQLRGVAALTPDSVWAVGGMLCLGPGPGHGLRTVIEHWDGRDWRVVSSPAAGMLTGVSTVSDSSAWAVGFSTGFSNGIIEHWDGTTWTWPAGLCGSPAGAGCLPPASDSPAPSG
jgi:hypothetical protein